MYFHSPICGPSVDAFRAVFVAAAAHAVQNKISHVVLAVHAKGNLDGVISDAIGEDAVKKLQKGPIPLAAGVMLGLSTERIAVPFLGDAVFIAAHTSTDYLKTIESNRKCKALFFAPWRDEELEDFLKRHPSTELKAEA